MVRRRPSAASTVFLGLFAAIVLGAGLLGATLALDARRSANTEAERLTLSVSQTLAADPAVVAAIRLPASEATAALQPITLAIVETTPIDFVTIMTPDGVRRTHPDSSRIGGEYLGHIDAALDGEVLTELFTGTLGPSIRTVVPLVADGEVVGLVASGMTVETLWDVFLGRLPVIIGIALAVLALGGAGAWIARILTRRIAGDLPVTQVQDAVSAYESVRTLGDALRAQTHEHGNRIHTAVALLELGRTEEAIALLTETTRVSQELVDRVVDGRGDPGVAALLLGKASEARQVGVDWRVEIAEDAPRSTMTTVDAVSLVGNLIDNAIAAAASAPAPRWVEVSMRRSGDDLEILVRDSGSGVDPAIRDRIMEPGFSTKPAGAAGRGIGLALARGIAERSGGRLELRNGSPTTFAATIPERRR